jgi:glycosyltransferase involved in cell wall biosynthesis
MNVVFVSNDPSIFSEQSSARKRMREYASAVGALHIISPAHMGTKMTHEEVAGGSLTLHPVHGRKPFMFLKMVRQTREIIVREKIQIVSAQDPFEYGWIAKRAVRGTNAKLHIQVHTDFLSPWFVRRHIYRSSKSHGPVFNKIRVRLADSVLPAAQGIRVVSERIYDSLITKYEQRILMPVVIPLTVSTDIPVPVPLPPHDFTFALITVGRLEPEKRIEDILYALQKITEMYPSAGLLIVGEGRERERLEHLTKTLGLESKVVFLGNRNDAWGLMQSAQAYIQASAYEGYGRTLAEAALARVPIITTDVGIVGEVLKGYDDVLAAPVADSSALATHIRRLIEDNEIRRQYVINAEKAIREHLAHVHSGASAVAADLQKLIAP